MGIRSNQIILYGTASDPLNKQSESLFIGDPKGQCANTRVDEDR